MPHKTMPTDPMPYFLFTGLLCGAIGFFGCALMSSRIIRRTEQDAYQDGFDACNRAHAPRKPRV